MQSKITLKQSLDLHKQLCKHLEKIMEYEFDTVMPCPNYEARKIASKITVSLIVFFCGISLVEIDPYETPYYKLNIDTVTKVVRRKIIFFTIVGNPKRFFEGIVTEVINALGNGEIPIPQIREDVV